MAIHLTTTTSTTSATVVVVLVLFALAFTPQSVHSASQDPTVASRVSSAPGLQGAMASDRFIQVFRDIARTAAGNNDFDSFHKMHHTLSEVSKMASRTELVSLAVLNKQIDAPAVFHAAYLGHVDFVRQFVEGGYSINKTIDMLPYLSVWREQRGLSDVSVQHLMTGMEVPGSVLHAAILGNHVELTRLLIASGVSVEGPEGAVQPLHLAAANDNVEIIDMLVTELDQTTINSATRELAETFTALHFASLYGNAAAVARLLELGADPNNALNPTGRTPLFLAAVSNDTPTVWLLLQHNASCTLPGADWSLLHIPIAANNFAMFEMLLEAHCYVEARLPNKETPLHIATRLNLPEYAERLIEHGANLEAELGNGDTAIIVAAKQNSVAVARVLLAHGASLEVVNQRTLGVLHAAARAGHAEMIELLVEHNVDTTATASGHSALEIVIMHEHLAALEKMLELKFEPHPSSLALACAGGNLEIIERLLNAGAQVNGHTGNANLSPLMAAAIFDHENAVRLLLLHGADYNGRDSFQNTVLMRAIFSDAQKSIAELLALPDLDIDAQNERGDTALHIAVDKRLKASTTKSDKPKFNTAVALTLVLAGADPDKTNNKRESVLHSAVYSDNQELLAAIIMAGADLQATDRDGNTAMDIAKNNKLDTARVTLLLGEQLASTEPQACFQSGWVRTVSYAVKRRPL